MKVVINTNDSNSGVEINELKGRNKVLRNELKILQKQVTQLEAAKAKKEESKARIVELSKENSDISATVEGLKSSVNTLVREIV